jgi:hypothetical protein
MDTATIGALSAVLGSLVGGTATAATSWMSQRALNRSKQIKDETRRREALYGEFISECAKLAVDALAHSLEKPETLLPAYALLNRIRLCASPAVLAEAENVLRRVTEQYFAKNLPVEQIRHLALSEDGDPLEALGQACRAELKATRAGA